MTEKEIKQVQKKTEEELQDFLQFKRRGSLIPAKRGRGSFKRQRKHRNRPENT